MDLEVVQLDSISRQRLGGNVRAVSRQGSEPGKFDTNSYNAFWQRRHLYYDPQPPRYVTSCPSCPWQAVSRNGHTVFFVCVWRAGVQGNLHVYDNSGTLLASHPTGHKHVITGWPPIITTRRELDRVGARTSPSALRPARPFDGCDCLDGLTQLRSASTHRAHKQRSKSTQRSRTASVSTSVHKRTYNARTASVYKCVY